MWHHKFRLTVWIAGIAAVTFLLVAGAMQVRRLGGNGEQPERADLWFEDVTDRAGLDFSHDVGDVSKWELPQINGSGLALFDYDDDGRLDLYFLNFGGNGSQSINRLYRNESADAVLRFKDVTEGSGLGIAGPCTGAIIGDVNNDGRPDVVVTQVGAVRLFLNRGKGTFQDVTARSGLLNPLWATSANLFDYDRDGWLDLVVVNYLEHDPTHVCYNGRGQRDYCGPNVFPRTVSKLFRNRGDAGKGTVSFEDVTVRSTLALNPGTGLGVFCADYNGDGWPDIFIANDARPNHLWINQRNGTFKEEAFIRGIAMNGMGQAQANMGVAVGDVDGDGLFDVYVTHLSTERNILWQQGPKRGEFVDRTTVSGLAASNWRGTGWGTLMGDFDQDGWPDLAVVNGAVQSGTRTLNPALGPHFQQYGERNQLFRNQGQGKFHDVSELNFSFCGTANVARGLAAGDLDGDGALDLVVTTVGDRARIYRNKANDRGHWLVVRAFDPRYQRDAYGAEVRLQVGKRSLLRIINPGDSYQSSSDPRAHFGLGKSGRYDSIHVRWPDGLGEVFPGGEADRVLPPLRRGEGKKQALP